MAKIGRLGLSEETRQKIKDFWRNGFSYTPISETVAVPPGSIYTLLKPTGGIHTKASKQRQGSLTFLEREEISRQIATGQTIRAIARLLHRNPSTISRGIARNGGATRYRAIDAEDRAFYKSRRPQKMKLAVNPLLREYVLSKLQKYWSPEQISTGC